MALGFSQIAASTLVTSVAEARDVIPREGKRITGTGAEILAETLRAADVKYIFGTSATGMSPFFDALTLNDDM